MMFLADAEPIPGSASSSDSDAVLTSIRPPAVVPSFGCAVAFLLLVLWAAGFSGDVDVEELLVVVDAVPPFDFFDDEDEAAFSDDADFARRRARGSDRDLRLDLRDRRCGDAGLAQIVDGRVGTRRDDLLGRGLAHSRERLELLLGRGVEVDLARLGIRRLRRRGLEGQSEQDGKQNRNESRAFDHRLPPGAGAPVSTRARARLRGAALAPTQPADCPPASMNRA
jgi:hypothetical protein